MTDAHPSPFEQDIMQTSDDDIKTYIGHHWDDYEIYWRLMRHKQPGTFIENVRHTNWLAVFLPPVWLLYRKLYLGMIAFFAAAFTCMYIFTELKIQMPLVVYGVIVAVMSRPLYLQRGVKVIKKIRAEGLDEATTKERIKLAGDISLPSALVGVVFIVGMLALALLLYGAPSDTGIGMATGNVSPLPVAPAK